MYPASEHPRRAFTLIEVVLALGIVAFVVVGIIGLYALATKTGGDSAQMTQAANLATSIIGQRRLTPVDDPANNVGTNNNLTNFSLPSLMPAVNPTDGQVQTNLDPTSGLPTTLVYSGYDGYRTTLGEAAYGVGYRTIYHTSSADVYLFLYWPPQAAFANAAGRYEVFTSINLP